MSDLVLQYFDGLTQVQQDQIRDLKGLYEDWNAKINVISRKDMDSFYLHHVVHSLALSYYWSPPKGARIIDIGTGGGFPGIPLAILRPDLNFLLVDSIGKKIKVVNEVAQSLGLTNVEGVHERAENVKGKFEVGITRAVARLATLVSICTEHKNLSVNRLYCLKGGDLTEEIKEVSHYPIMDFQLKHKFAEPFFETKKVVLVDLK
jgi:16S rRNA (guanine527-N7)-methyltransferase